MFWEAILQLKKDSLIQTYARHCGPPECSKTFSSTLHEAGGGGALYIERQLSVYRPTYACIYGLIQNVKEYF